MAMRYRHLKQCSFNKDAVAVYRFVCYLIYTSPLQCRLHTFSRASVSYVNFLRALIVSLYLSLFRHALERLLTNQKER